MALFEQVEHADNILFYIDDNQIIFTDSIQGDNEVDLLQRLTTLGTFWRNAAQLSSHHIQIHRFIFRLCVF